jgi:NADH:ubiquinone oxidoreductase subunit 5 (subunit L)/multisubunit Na+/H+ antiporter MnhA subunit
MIITIIFLPLLGAIVSGFLGFTIGKRGAQVITVSSIFISMLLSYRMFFLVGFEHNNYFLNFMP